MSMNVASRRLLGSNVRLALGRQGGLDARTGACSIFLSPWRANVASLFLFTVFEWHC
jgi:hypothetical protein